jgi:hypothetical protein
MVQAIHLWDLPHAAEFRQLHGASDRCGHVPHPLPEDVTVDAIAVAEEIPRGFVPWERVHDLLGRPLRGGMRGDVEVDDAPAMVSEHDEDEEHPQACGGYREEIEGDQVRDVVGEKRAPGLRRGCAPLRHQPGNGSLGHLDAELPEFAMDSRGPHRGFIAVMFLMRAVISALIGGRPTRGRPESLVQCSRKRRRCHRRTVSGDTMTRACLQPAQTLASPTHNRRSIVRSLGRGAIRL